MTIGPQHRNNDFDDLYRECFGTLPHKGLDNSDPDRASDTLRDTLDTGSRRRPRPPCHEDPSSSSMAHSGSPARTTNGSSRYHKKSGGARYPSCRRCKKNPGHVGGRAPAPSCDEGPSRPARHHRPVVDGESIPTFSTTPSTGKGGTGRSTLHRSTRTWHGR